MLARYKEDRQISILSYGQGQLVSDFNPIAVMHESKIREVKTDNQEVSRKVTRALRQLK